MPVCNLGPHKSLAYSMAGCAEQKKTAIFLHGIMGNKKNLDGFVKKFVSAHKSWTALVFDLPNHGESDKNLKPYSIEAASEFIIEALHKLNIAPQAIVGHSFGGKVALLVAKSFDSIKQIWIWDSFLEAEPALRPLPGPGFFTAFEIMDILAELPWPLPSRSAVTTALEARGASRAIALWMSTNLIAVPDGFLLIFSLEAVRAMLKSYLEFDAWPLIETLGRSKSIHLVAASKGGRLGELHKKKLSKLVPQGSYFYMLENAGHFVHSDNPSGLLALMAPHFI